MPNLQVLVVGLMDSIPDPDMKARVTSMVHGEVDKAKAENIDVTIVSANPDDIPGTLEKTKTVLQSQQWDGFNVGFGVRGNQSMTPLFEQVVNLGHELAPKAKLMFSETPDSILKAIKRAYPDGKK